MATANPTRTNPPDSEARLHDPVALPDTSPPLRDPRSVAAIDNIGVDDQADLLDVELDDQVGDDGDHRNFADDVRSDSNDDERHERR
jgi:hypothetical protein